MDKDYAVTEPEELFTSKSYQDLIPWQSFTIILYNTMLIAMQRPDADTCYQLQKLAVHG